MDRMSMEIVRNAQPLYIRRHYVCSHRLYDKRDLLVEAAKLPETTLIYAQATEKSELLF